MGLDMYAYTAKRSSVRRTVNFKLDELEEVQELHYWRKHPDAHGFFEALWIQKGATAEVFNCEPLLLEREDIDAFEHAVRSHALPETSGFFFGESDASDFADDIAFIEKARAALAEGKAVIYDSWW